MSALLPSPIKPALAAAMLLGALNVTAAHATTIDFSSVDGQFVDGTTVDGVTFGYTEFGSSSPAAIFTNIGTGVAQNLSPEAIVGYADGSLTLNFASPIQALSFVVGESVNYSLMPGFSVSLYDASGNPVETANIDTDFDPSYEFTGGEFSYGGGPVSKAVISFDSADANEFALGSVSVAVPEPSNIAVFATGLLLLGTVLYRRRQV